MKIAATTWALFLHVFCVVLPALGVETVEEPACRHERWVEAMEKFRVADEKQPTEPGGVVFVGSSSIRFWDLPEFFPERQGLLNRGFGGSELCDSVHYFDTLVAKHQPKVVVLYAGDNDVAAGKQAAQVHKDFLEFIELTKEKLPDSRLCYIAIKPSIARWKLADEMLKANRLIAAECKKQPQRLAFVDIWQPMLGEDGKPRRELFVKDGLHLSKQGYKLWTQLLEQKLVEGAQR